MQSIIIFGSGIAGLSAAHELVQLGYSVTVYEATDQAGGFFRSARLGKDNMPEPIQKLKHRSGVLKAP